MKALTTTTLALLLFACGSGTAPSSNAGATEQDAARAESCGGHQLGDPCITEENFARCLELEQTCPGQVLQLESCPLQFACT